MNMNVVSAVGHAQIEPDDDRELVDGGGTPMFQALYIEGDGDIAVSDGTGTVVVYTVPAGTVLWVTPHKVNKTGTTVLGVVGWKF